MSQVLLGALRLPAEVIAAAGSLGFSIGMLPATNGDPAAAAALGAVITSGVTWRTRSGTTPRLVETPAGAVYTPGTATVGVDLALRRHARLWAAAPYAVIVNLHGAGAADFPLAAGELEGLLGVVALELDLATPDGETGQPFAFDLTTVRRIVNDVRRVCDLPLLLKLPAETPHLSETLRGAATLRVSAVTLGAGLPAAVPAPAEWPRSRDGVRDSFTRGRLVGPATFPVLLELVARVAPDAPLPIVACGGIVGPVQARAYLRAGAAAVQVGSAHLANPRAAAEIQRGLDAPDA